MAEPGTTVLLVRHATTAATGARLGGWTPGVHLDPDGVAQAQQLGQRLADVPIEAVYASPLERTQETAGHLAEAHGLTVRTLDALGEVDYGRWTDRPLQELRDDPLWQQVQHAPSRVRFPEGETIRAAQARAVEATERFAAEHRGAVIAAVSHADVIKAVVAHHLGMPLDSFQRLVIAPASVTVLHLPAAGAPALLVINDTGAATPPLPEPPKAS